MKHNELLNKINWFKFCWLTLTKKGFRFWLAETLIYTIRIHKIARGIGSSDIKLFLKSYLPKALKKKEGLD